MHSQSTIPSKQFYKRCEILTTMKAILKKSRSQCHISLLGAEIDRFLQSRAPNKAFDSGHFWKCFCIFENFAVAGREMKGFVFPLRYCAIHQTQNKFVRARGTHCDIIRYHKRRSWSSSPPALSSVHLVGCNPAGNDISSIRSNAKRHFHGGDSILDTAYWDSIDVLEEENIIWHPIYCFVINEKKTPFEKKQLRSSRIITYLYPCKNCHLFIIDDAFMSCLQFYDNIKSKK